MGMMRLVGQIPVPVIGVVTGHAAAAGCQLIASCDLVVAGPNAKFSTPGAAVGLVCRLVPEDMVDAEVETICSAILSKPRGVVALGKRFYQQQLELPLAKAYPAGGDVMVDNLWYKDAQEGIQAFKEKRKPVFTHGDEKV